LIYRKEQRQNTRFADTMGAFLYRCPVVGIHVQGWTENESADPDEYESVACLACQRVHLVNPATGKVMGKEDE
jgi:hypothetical protein